MSEVIYGRRTTCGEELDAFEREFKISLPSDYREFMLKHNGLDIGPGHEVSFAHNKIDGLATFSYLYQFSDGRNPNVDLTAINRELDAYLEHVPSAIVIGTDNSTDQYVLVCSGGMSGCYFWDKDHFYQDVGSCDIDEVDESGKMYKVSDSFSGLHELLLRNIKACGDG